MHLNASELVGVLDRIGIVAFAFSGVEVGARRRLDIFGLLVMGIVTATGGGFMRDVAIGREPLVLARWDYLAWAAGSAVVGIALVAAERAIPRRLVAVADAAGLGAFATAGALAGIHAELPVTAVIVLAMLTATGGGVVRDLLADRVPMVLRTEVNATAAGIAGLAVWAVEPASAEVAAVIGVAVGASLRVIGLAFDLHLPAPGGTSEGEQGRLL